MHSSTRICHAHSRLHTITIRIVIICLAFLVPPTLPVRAQPAACDSIGATNCQFLLGDGLAYLSDLSAAESGVIVADDFVPAGTTIADMCVWGAYMDSTGDGGTGTAQFDCADSALTWEFSVRVFLDGGDDSDPMTSAGLPGELVGESRVSWDRIFIMPEPGTFLEATYGVVMQKHQLFLDWPITSLQPGLRHWLEITHLPSDPEVSRCRWFWAQHIFPVGDGYSASGIRPHSGDPYDLWDRPSIYVDGSARSGADLAFCLNDIDGPLDFTPPPAHQAACWTCGDDVVSATCSVETLQECSRQDGVWNRLDPTCAESSPVLEGNDCVVDSNIAIGPGLHSYDNTCATRDGPDVVRYSSNEFRIDGDIWYEYTVHSTTRLTIGTCATQTAWTQDGNTGLNSVLAVYHEYGNRCADGINMGQSCQCQGSFPQNSTCYDTAQCPGSGLCKNMCVCPGPIDQVSPYQITSYYQGCNGLPDKSGVMVEVNFAVPGECYTIQVGSPSATGEIEESAERGRGLLHISEWINPHQPPDPPLPEMGLDNNGQMVPWRKPRMLSFQGGTLGRSEAVRVTFVDMPPGWEEWNGVQLFVQQPWLASETPSTRFASPVEPGDEVLQVAELGCEPFFATWDNYGVVHIIHGAIAPSRFSSPSGPVEHATAYEIDMLDEISAVSCESCYSDPLVITTCAWGDVVSLSQGNYRTPDDRVSIADVIAMVAKFEGDPGAPSKASLLLKGLSTGPMPTLDGQLTILEVVMILEAFQGGDFGHYWFSSDDMGAPPACPP